jgi:hypothetical protein
VLWGAWIEMTVDGRRLQAPFDPAATTAFEAMTGKGASLVHWSSPFSASYCAGSYCSFQRSLFDTVQRSGAVPLLSWANNPGTGAFSNASVAAGAQDAYVRQWARDARDWGHPFLLRFAWEMNASWFAWGAGTNGNTPAEYVAMWRHVHDIFVEEGATNVAWVWCPNVDPYHKFADLAGFYPGAAYVDWVCLDSYNGNDPRMSFEQLISDTYGEITSVIAPGKPMLIAETASTEVGGSKAEWIAEMFDSLSRYPMIRGVAWFNKPEAGPGQLTDWPLQSSAAAQDSFALGIAADRFVARGPGAGTFDLFAGRSG